MILVLVLRNQQTFRSNCGSSTSATVNTPDLLMYAAPERMEATNSRWHFNNITYSYLLQPGEKPKVSISSESLKRYPLRTGSMQNLFIRLRSLVYTFWLRLHLLFAAVWLAADACRVSRRSLARLCVGFTGFCSLTVGWVRAEEAAALAEPAAALALGRCILIPVFRYAVSLALPVSLVSAAVWLDFALGFARLRRFLLLAAAALIQLQFAELPPHSRWPLQPDCFSPQFHWFGIRFVFIFAAAWLDFMLVSPVFAAVSLFFARFSDFLAAVAEFADAVCEAAAAQASCYE